MTNRVDIQSLNIPKGHYCYLLQSISKPRRTYIGYTNNPKRRIRQHNGEIKGGAKRTNRARPWKMICYIGGFRTHREGLQFEWKNHHPNTRRYGVNGRIKNLTDILNMRQWTSNSPITDNRFFAVYWLESGHNLSYNINNCIQIYHYNFL